VLGDSADGFPGIAGWGEKAASRTLSRYPRLEDIPKDWRQWDASISNARRLATSLFGCWEDALLFRTLATLRLDAPVFESVDDLRWKGPRADFESLGRAMESPDLFKRAKSALAAQPG
jgi:5'-3' exonuclease